MSNFSDVSESSDSSPSVYSTLVPHSECRPSSNAICSNDSILSVNSVSTSAITTTTAILSSPLIFTTSNSANCSPKRVIELPTFVSNVPDSVNNVPTPRFLAAAPMMEFATPTHQPRKLGQSRPNSPSNSTRPVPSRGRIASIRRESDCSGENEAAHEKLVKTTHQVSIGFEDFCLDERFCDERKRAKSLTEPITILTNAFLSHSSSPSPTRNAVDTQKQCYSPSTKQVVRNNIPYSPSPSPTPSSPTRGRIMRSMSPIAVRQISKRRYTGSGSGSGLESDGESPLGTYYLPAKRHCTTPSSAASPLARDSLSGATMAQLVNAAMSTPPHESEFS